LGSAGSLPLPAWLEEAPKRGGEPWSSLQPNAQLEKIRVFVGRSIQLLRSRSHPKRLTPLRPLALASRTKVHKCRKWMMEERRGVAMESACATARLQSIYNRLQSPLGIRRASTTPCLWHLLALNLNHAMFESRPWYRMAHTLLKLNLTQ
jgi:hypothetical protein